MKTSCAFALSLLTALAGTATAQEFELRNDSLVDGGTGAIQAGFAPGDIGAAVFNTSPSNFPLKIKRVQIMWYSLNPPQPDQEQGAINFYQGGAENPPRPVLVRSLGGPVMRDGGLNEFDVSGENIVFNSGPFAVGLLFLNPVNPYLGPSLVTDTNGCQLGKNLIYDPSIGWTNGCSLGISGDLVIRVICEYVGQSADIVGQVQLGSWVGDTSQLTLELTLKSGGQVVETVTAPLDAFGTYSVTVHNVGTFDVVARVSRWLSEKKTNVTIGGATQINWSLPRNGDVSLDNAIGLDDLNIVLINFAKTNAAHADVDGSGQVNLVDLNTVLTFFGQFGAQ